MSKIVFVNLSDLNLPQFQAHTKVPTGHLTEIAESIKALGVLEPLLIRGTKKGFEIIAGCVRFQAAHLAGLKAVPCIVMQLGQKESEIVKLHENIKRVPLDHIDQAMTFIMMIEEFGMTEQQISDVTGSSIAYISQHISLVRFDDDLTAEVKEGNISFSQARELMRVDDKTHREELLNFCKNDGASVQVLHSWVQDYLRKPVASFPEQSVPDSSDSQDPPPELIRVCGACDVNVPISQIRQVFYCPNCDNAIKKAISEEKSKNS